MATWDSGGMMTDQMMMMGWNYINKRGFGGGGAAMEDATGGWRKGPWTSEEDKLLSHYVQQHGEGRWNSVSRITGLRRNGKSCRLRWVNYLRPDLKRGQITPQEETIILELHARWGNRWSNIARSLPGRTDNEIKNYWRTHFKKKTPTLDNSSNISSAAAQKTRRARQIRRQQFKQQLIMMSHHQQQLDMNKFASLQLEDDHTPTRPPKEGGAGLTTALPHPITIAAGEADDEVLAADHNDYSLSEGLSIIDTTPNNIHPPNGFLWDGFWDFDQNLHLDAQLSATTIEDDGGGGGSSSSRPDFMLSLPFD